MSAWHAWSVAELAIVQAIKPGERGALDRAAAKLNLPRHVVARKLNRLRILRVAPDVDHRKRGNPFPRHRFG